MNEWLGKEGLNYYYGDCKENSAPYFLSLSLLVHCCTTDSVQG